MDEPKNRPPARTGPPGRGKVLTVALGLAAGLLLYMAAAVGLTLWEGTRPSDLLMALFLVFFSAPFLPVMAVTITPAVGVPALAGGLTVVGLAVCYLHGRALFAVVSLTAAAALLTLLVALAHSPLASA